MKIQEKIGDQAITVSAVYKGDKKWEANDKVNNWNNHRITISRPWGRTSFDFWASIMNPEIRKQSELRHAVYCFVSDAAAGRMKYEEFCSEFGYDQDSMKANHVWIACKKAAAKCDRLLTAEEQDVILVEWQ